MLYAQPIARPGEWDVQNFMGFSDTNELPNLGQMTRPIDTYQKREPTK